MLNSPHSLNNQILYSKDKKEKVDIKNENKENLESYLEINKLNNDEEESEDLDEEKENKSCVERIKVYHTKKNNDNIEQKQNKKLYHNEINKKPKKEIRVLRKNKSKIKSDIHKLKIINSIDELGNYWNTDRADEKNDDIHCITMATTPKRKFTNTFKNLISLNKDKNKEKDKNKQKKIISQKNSESFLKNNINKNYYHQTNLMKSNDFSELLKVKDSDMFLTSREYENEIVGKYLWETDTNYSTREIKEPLNIKNIGLNKIYDKKLKTQREKSFNKFSLKDEFNNKKEYYNNIQKSFSKNSSNKNFIKNKNVLNLSHNSSKKNLFPSRVINNNKLNIREKSYKSLSKSKQNSNSLNKSFNFSKATNNNNFYIKEKLGLSFKKNNYKNKLYKNPKDTNKYLAPIIESNIVIENENCHFLENTICAKNKIVKKKKNLYGQNINEECPTLTKINKLIENNEKKNNKNPEKTKNDKEKGINLLAEANKNTNKLTFTNALSQLYKKPQKKQGINLKKNISNKKNKKKNIDIPVLDLLNHNRNASRQKAYHSRAESIESNISNLSTISNTSGFNGKIDDYLVTKELGKGSYAIVKLATHKVTKQKYAIKIYTKALLLDPKKRNTVKNEINILKQLNHNNIMKLYEVIDTPKYLYLVQEYIKGVSLLEILKNEKCHYIEQERAIKIFLQIINGISYCQSKNINHRDIKLENILVIEDDIVKIIDFGFAVKSNKETFHKFFCGTPSYMAPEIINREKYIAQYSDIWSLGVLLYTMLFGRFPFRAKDDDQLFELINQGNIEFPDDILVDDYIKNLIKNILIINPLLRPTLEDIIDEITFGY